MAAQPPQRPSNWPYYFWATFLTSLCVPVAGSFLYGFLSWAGMDVRWMVPLCIYMGMASFAFLFLGMLFATVISSLKFSNRYDQQKRRRP